MLNRTLAILCGVRLGFFGVLVERRGVLLAFEDIDLKLEYGPCAVFLLYLNESIDLM